MSAAGSARLQEVLVRTAGLPASNGAHKVVQGADTARNVGAETQAVDGVTDIQMRTILLHRCQSAGG